MGNEFGKAMTYIALANYQMHYEFYKEIKLLLDSKPFG